MEFKKRLGKKIGERFIEDSRNSQNSRDLPVLTGKDFSGSGKAGGGEYEIHDKNAKNFFEISGEYLTEIKTKSKYSKDAPSGILDYINKGELLRKNSELMGMTKELESRNRELQESNKLKDLFIDIMRHDILSPAGVIRSYSELILEDDPGNQDVEIIHKNTLRLINMVDKTNLYSLLESKRNIDCIKIDLKNLIEDVCMEFQPVAENIGLKIENNISNPMPFKTNPLFREVFLNLLTNVEKYAAGGKKLIIDASDQGHEYLISFKDFGEGIPARHREKVFNRFQRINKGPIKGTGLGLAIVKRMVEMQGGSIWVEDNIVEFKENGKPVKKKQGCVFKIKLPKNIAPVKKYHEKY